MPSQDSKALSGPVQVDETSVGGKRKSVSNVLCKEAAGTGRGPAVETAVTCATGHETNLVAATFIQATDAATLMGAVMENADSLVTINTDNPTVYESLPFDYDSLRHPPSNYGKGELNANGTEGLRSPLKRTHTSTLHKLSRNPCAAPCRSTADATTCRISTRSIRSKASAAGWKASG